MGSSRRSYLLVAVVLGLCATGGFAAFGRGHHGGGNKPPIPTISGVVLSNGTGFTTPATSGTTIDTLTATCSVGSCVGATFALSTTGGCSGASSNSSFAISGSNLNIGGSTVNAGSYPIGIAVTLAGASNSGTCYPSTLTGTGGGAQTIASIALSNNTTTTGLSSGTAVGTLSVTMSAATPIFTGYTSAGLTLTPTVGGCNGADNASFQIVNDQLQTNGTLTAGTKNICVAATQAGATGSPLKQSFAITIGNRFDAAATYCASNGGGNGSSGSPWHYNCIQAAVNAAGAGDTVFLAGGNWVLDSGDATFVSINKPGITLAGVSSGNTFDAFGHINNASGITMCPTGGTSITCVKQTGTSYMPGQPANWKGFIRFGLDGAHAPNCTTESVANIFFDGSSTTAGGDYDGILTFDQCPGPITMDNIRTLTYFDAGFNGSTQLFASSSANITITNSMLGVPPFSGGNLGTYSNGQAFESSTNSGMTFKNNFWWQGVHNATFDENITISGSIFDLRFMPRASTGMAGCGLDPSLYGGHLCGTNGGGQGSFFEMWRNNYWNAGGSGFAIGGGVNDWSGIPATSTTGNINDIHLIGNWLFGSDVALDACAWHIFTAAGGGQACANNGQSINAHADTACNLTNNGTPYDNLNNSMIGTATARLNAYGENAAIPCFGVGFETTGIFVNAEIFNYNGQQNYLNSPSNQYNSNANTFNATVPGLNNFCAGGGTFTGTDGQLCRTSGFTTLPTVSAFTLSPLGVNGTVLFNISGLGFTAQYGAVHWLASTSPTTPTSSGQAGTGLQWSFVPPYSLSATHGNTVYLWVMDSAGGTNSGNISASPATALVP